MQSHKCCVVKVKNEEPLSIRTKMRRSFLSHDLGEPASGQHLWSCQHLLSRWSIQKSLKLDVHTNDYGNVKEDNNYTFQTNGLPSPGYKWKVHEVHCDSIMNRKETKRVQFRCIGSRVRTRLQRTIVTSAVGFCYLINLSSYPNKCLDIACWICQFVFGQVHAGRPIGR